MVTKQLQQLADRAQVPAQVMTEALGWLVQQWSNESDTQNDAELQRWLQRGAEHKRAWQLVQSVHQRLDAVADPAAAKGLRAAHKAAVNRRQALQLLSLLGVAVLGGYGVSQSSWLMRQGADVRTATGEIRSLTLPDGSQLTLNTATAVNLHFDALQRQLALLEGEILIETAPDNQQPARPFSVTTELAQLEPLGTRFVVRQTQDGSGQLTVLEGAVRLRPQQSAQSQIIDAGMTAHYNAQRIEQVGPAQGGADWSDGRLVVERQRLSQVLDELNRYRAGMIHYQPEAGELMVSGTFPVDNTDQALSMLASALPIQVNARLPFWVSVKKIAD